MRDPRRQASNSPLRGFTQSAVGVSALGLSVLRATVFDTARFHTAQLTKRPRRIAWEIQIRLSTPLGLRALRAAQRPLTASSDSVRLGVLDQYGSLVPEDDLAHVCNACHDRPPTAEGDERTRRVRATLELLCTGNELAVRKTFLGRDAKRRFVHEVRLLRHLAESDCSVPALLSLDPQSLSVTTTYAGESIEQALIAAGARVRGDEVRALAGGSPTVQESWTAYYREGARVISNGEVVDSQEVLAALRAAHREGVTLREVSYSNLVRGRDGRISIIDFEAATIHRNPKSASCLIERDRDLDSFNRGFSGSALTRERILTAILRGDPPLADAYGSAYIGHGISFGRISDPSSGFGKWHFGLKNRIGRVRGRSVVSLGANNCTIELMMLRSGASSVTAYELSPTYRDQAHFLHEAIEWADNRHYDLRITAGNMTDFAEESSEYEVGLALCSLYYLDEPDMRRVATSLERSVRQVILQCNVGRNIGREDEDQYRRASVGFTQDLLIETGFSSVRTWSPARYSRPVVSAATSARGVEPSVDLRESVNSAKSRSSGSSVVA